MPAIPGKQLTTRFAVVRAATERLCEPLEPEDYQLQSMPDASPPKWHLAHTTWFFETFLLLPNVSGYRVFHPTFSYLFNSYYETVSATRSGTSGKISGSCAIRMTGAASVILASVPGRSSTPVSTMRGRPARLGPIWRQNAH